MLEKGEDFTFETVLSTDRNIKLLKKAKEKGYFIPLKANISQEILESQGAISKLNLEILEKIEFKLPIENSHRTIIKFIKTKKTSSNFPRKNSEIKKRPL